jgi:hypothetical protein
MYRPLVLLGGVGIVVALHVAGARALGSSARRIERQTVTVTIRCTGARGPGRANPNVVELTQGDSLDWVLSDDSDEASFDIVPQDHPNGRRAQDWPFGDVPGERRGRRGAPARGHAMSADAAGLYRYAIQPICGGGGGDAPMIDPDIIIRAK